MTELRDRASDIYYSCETHGGIVDKIERMLILETQNADLLAALESILEVIGWIPVDVFTVEGRNDAQKRIKSARAAIAKAKGKPHELPLV
jgi:hypothetical protein